MQTQEPYRLIGGPGSPYSMKLRAALRYRHLPHRWIVPTGYINQGGELARTGKKTIPVLQYPEDGSYWADSTPLIYALEQRHPGHRSLIPDNPAHAFLSHLIDDFADELLIGALFNYRWGNAADLEFCPRRQLAGWLGNMPTEQFEKIVPMFRARQVQKLQAGDYGAPTSAALFEHIYFELLAAIEMLATESRFLFGSRPSLGEFGLYGQLSQLAIDPTASALMKQRAPRAFQWVQDLDDASGMDGEWASPSTALPMALHRVLTLMAEVYLPVAQSHLNAFMSGESRTHVTCAGMSYEGVTNAYTARCLLLLKDEFARLDPTDQADVASRLGASATADYLQFQSGERERMTPVIPV